MSRSVTSSTAVAMVGGLLALVAGSLTVDAARAAEDAVKPPAARVARPRVARPAARTAEARPLTIRRRPDSRPVDVVGVGPGFYDGYLVRQHGWDDPRLYYFGPFRTGGESFYGDQRGNPITRGNAGLGQIAGYGPANGGYGGPHFDSVGGFHNGPGPDAKIEDDYASGSLSRPDYAFTPRYPSVKARVAALTTGVVSRDTTPSQDRLTGPRMVAEGRSTNASFEEAKARFAAPMARQAPVESAFANGGLRSIGIDDGAF